MNTFVKIGVVAVLLVAIAAVLIVKSRREPPAAGPGPVSPVTKAQARPGTAAGLPRLVDLGAHSCIPCKMMAPILEELSKEYEGRMAVEFIDVWENREAGQAYGISRIPTQIFFAASGEELARHEGFISKEDILAQWAAVGVSLGTPSARQE